MKKINRNDPKASKLIGAPFKKLKILNDAISDKHYQENYNLESSQISSRSILWVIFFVLTLAIPVNMYFGPLRLNFYRIYLISIFIPCIFILLSRVDLKIIRSDLILITFLFLTWTSLVYNNGIAQTLETQGVLIIETFGAYLIGRCFIRNKEDFKRIHIFTFFLICIFIPLAFYEVVTDRAIIIEIISKIITTIPQSSMDPRFGLFRAQVVFEHPILYGVFCSSVFALAYYVLSHGRSLVTKLTYTWIVGLASALSVSTGAVASILIQILLIIWDLFTKSFTRRWLILLYVVIAAYFILDLISNRTPFHVFVTYLTFSEATAYARINIFEWGWASVEKHPLLGIGLNDWERPSWKSASMDNFWLVIAVKYGLPAFLALAGAFGSLMFAVGRMNFDDPEVNAYRTGWLISLGGLIIAAATVHYWNAIYCYFMFLLGSGSWFLDATSVKASSTTVVDKRAPKSLLAARRRRAGTEKQAHSPYHARSRGL